MTIDSFVLWVMTWKRNEVLIWLNDFSLD